MFRLFFSIIFFIFIILSPQKLFSQSRKAIETSTDVLMFVVPAAGIASSLVLKDYKGVFQLALSGATTFAATQILKRVVEKKRPDGSDNLSFPSNHTAISFSGAAYIQRRYGWKYGAAAYAVSAYVGWGRIYAKRHDIWDVAAGAAIGIACGYIYTRPFAKKYQLSLSPAMFGDNGYGIYCSINL